MSYIDPEILANARAALAEHDDMPRSTELFDLMVRVADLGHALGSMPWASHSEVTRWAAAEVVLAGVMLARCLDPIMEAEAEA